MVKKKKNKLTIHIKINKEINKVTSLKMNI